MRFGLRAQISLTLLLLTGGAVWLIGLGSLNLTRRSLLDQAELTGRRLSTQIADALGDALTASEGLSGPRNRERAATIVAPYYDALLFQQFELFTPEGQLAMVYPEGAASRSEDGLLRAPIAALGAQPRVFRVDHGDWGASLVVDVPVRRADRPIGTARLVYPLLDSIGRLQTAQLMTVLYTMLSALLIFIVGYGLLTRLMVTPIRRIGVAAQRVAAGDHASRIAVGSHNELGAVASNLNEMLDRLEEGREALQQKVEALAAAKAELEAAQAAIVRSEKLASVGRLAAGVAHEVGNPLAAILGLVEVLGETIPEVAEAGGDLDDADMARDLLQRVEREVMRIHNIIRELLDYARDGASAEPEDPVEGGVDVAEALDSVCKLVGHQPKFRKIVIERTVDPQLPRAGLHQDRLTQVLLNLLMNAADALEGGGHVWATAVQVGTEVCVSIRDDGPGIDPATLAHLFEPFYTTKAPGEGTGLGLAICERIVERAGGRIEVESPPDGGVAFHVWLPVSSATERDAT